MARRDVRRLRELAILVARYANWWELVRTRPAPPTRLVLRRGPRIEGPPSGQIDVLVDEVFRDRVYTPPGFSIGPEDRVVDIGGNVGVFTLFAARQTSACVHVYEPHPENVRFLRRNIESNGITNVEVHENAVSAETGSARLWVSDRTASHRLFDRDDVGRPLTESLRVEAITLEDLMERDGLDRIDFLKMDCEGSEGAIIFATPEECLRMVRRISIEYHDDLSEPTWEGIARRLTACGFDVSRQQRSRSHGYLHATRN